MDVRTAFTIKGRSAYLAEHIGCKVKELLAGDRTVSLCDGYAKAPCLQTIKIRGEVVPWDEYHASGMSTGETVAEYRRTFDEGIRVYDTEAAEQEVERIISALAAEIQDDATPEPCVVYIAALQFDVSHSTSDGLICGDCTAYYKTLGNDATIT